MPVCLMDVSTSQWAERWWGEINLNKIYSRINLSICATQMRAECRKQNTTGRLMCVCSASWTASEWLRWSVSAWWISLSDYSSSVRHVRRNDWTAPFTDRFLLFLVIHRGIKVEGSKTTSSEWITFSLHKWSVWMAIRGHASVKKKKELWHNLG